MRILLVNYLGLEQILRLLISNLVILLFFCYNEVEVKGMKKKSTGWYLLLFSAIVILFSVNFNNSFGFLIGENGEQITSTSL